MRNSRVIATALFVAMALAGGNVFAKVCHPRKPITCGVDSFSQPAATTTVAPAPKPVAKAVTSKKPAPTQQAVVCGPWIRTFPYCKSTGLASAFSAVIPATPVKSSAPVKQQAVVCGPWIRTFPYCKAAPLG